MSRKRNLFPSHHQRFAPTDQLDLIPEIPASVHRLWAAKRGAFTPGTLLRGYVVAVYAPDDASAGRSPAAIGLPDRVSPYLCDVQIVEASYASILPRVPIATMCFGLTDRVQWVPRAATIDVKAGNALQLESSPTSKASPIHDSDGDLVIVAFLDNDVNKPIIIGALPNPNTLVPVAVDAAQKYKWEATIRGNVVGIEEGGKVVVDATGQTDGVVQSDGSEAAAGDATVEIRTNGATITVNDDGVTIEVASGKKTTIGGNSATGMAEAVVKAGGWNDLFGSTGAFWLEAVPILTAAGAMLGGLPTTTLTALLGTFATGYSTTGATLTTDSTESE